MKIENIFADNEVKPIGLTSVPRFSWQTSGNEKTYGFSLQIASSAELLNVSPDVLDSGLIETAAQYYYNPSVQLKPFTRYFWNVRVYFEGGSVKSGNMEFVTSVLVRSQWKALQFRNFESVDVSMIKKEFTLDKTPECAYLFVAATGEKSNGYHVYVNGRKITKGMIMPGPLEYMTMNVIGFDVTDLMMRSNTINIDHVSGVSAILKIYFADGGTFEVKTDESWVAYGGESPYVLGYNEGFTPTRHHGKYEFFDRTKVPEAWYDFGAQNITAKPNGGFWGPLNIRYSGVKTGIRKVVSAEKIIKCDGGYTVDFGRIQSGFVGITLHNFSGKIKIQYAECVSDGKPLESQYGNIFPPICEYISCGGENEEYIPDFMHTSYRYIHVSGLNYEPSAEDFKAYFVYSDVKEKSSFACSNDNLNYIDKCIRRSYKSNLLNVPTDCPGRERRGWTADSYAVIDSQCFMFDVYNIYNRWFRDLKDNQRINGWCTVEYPDQTDPCIDINWPMHIIIDPWTLYEHYGDIRILRENIESMEKYAELLYSISENHLFAENLFSYGDWVSLERASADYLGAAFYYYVTLLIGKAEDVLENREAATKYYERSREIADAINARYYNDENGYYDTGTQTANILALFFGFCKDKKRVFKSLTNDIEQRNMLTVGVFGNVWLYRVLGDGGRNDLAYRLLTDESVSGSSVLAMVNAVKSETLAESFTNLNDSLNHMFLGGGPSSWFYRNLMGVSHDAGFENYVVNPYFPPDMTDLNISFDTPNGVLGLKWKKTNNAIDITVTAPCNSNGTALLGGKEYILTHGENTFTVDT